MHHPSDLFSRITNMFLAMQPSEKPISELIEQINTIWRRKGIKPKQHLSEPCPGAETVMEKRKHADRCVTLPPDLPEDMDLMIEVSVPVRGDACLRGSLQRGLWR